MKFINKEMIDVMIESVNKECKDLNEQVTGVSVVLWKLRWLLDGYKYALDHGYSPTRDERETNP